MIDLTTTRANHLVDPVLHVWAWQIPIYLFLGGLVAGMMVLTGWWRLTGRPVGERSVLPALPVLGLVLLSAGMFALFLDLEHKFYVWRLYLTFQWRSPMSWGAWILVAVYPVLVATLLTAPPTWAAAWVPRWTPTPQVARGLAAANVAFGAMLGIYTGILLSALGARPAWNSALLGPLFLASGLSSAAALMHLVTRDHDEGDVLMRGDTAFLGAELVLLALVLIGLSTSTRAHQAAADLFLGGPYTAALWVGVVGAGILVPLLVQVWSLRGRIRHTAVAPLLVLGGGLLLRFVIVSAGQFSHWRAF